MFMDIGIFVAGINFKTKSGASRTKTAGLIVLAELA
jgi:hypothetical protein